MAAPRAAESINVPDLNGAFTIRFTTRLEYQARDTETQRKKKKREPMLREFRLPEYRQP
jgi:hypothetical protein